MHVLFQVKTEQRGLTELKVLLEQVYMKQTSHLQEQMGVGVGKGAKSLKQGEENGFSSMISIHVASAVVGIAHSTHSLSYSPTDNAIQKKWKDH